jgi:SAM-dependent methyltransferase
MSFHTTSALYTFAARCHLPASARICNLFHQNLEISDQALHWLIAQRQPFIQRDLLRKMLTLDRLARKPQVPEFFRAIDCHPLTSIDSRPLNGSLVMDLNLSLVRDYGYTETFDLIINDGSLEHIFDQRAVFENVHQLCRVGGVILHKFPMTFDALNITLFGYPPSFTYDVALANDYEILDFRLGNRWGDTVPARLDETNPVFPPIFRPALPRIPGFAQGVGQEGKEAEEVLSPDQTEPDLRLPDSLSLKELLAKTSLSDRTNPLANSCRALVERGRRFRPSNPGEIYSYVLFRKLSAASFRIPYHGKHINYIESEEWRDRYRRQFDRLQAAAAAGIVKIDQPHDS